MITQIYSHPSDLPRKRGCSEVFRFRAARTGRTPVARAASTDGQHASGMASTASGTFSSSPSSASGSVAMTVCEAGRKGGLSCLCNRGRAFFIEIGKKGQLEMRRKHPGMAAEWGKRGGRPRKPILDEIMG